MGSALVGAAHHGGVLPIGGTFLVFSDYMRPAVRLAALSEREGRVRVEPRLGGRRRGRPDAPADRARDVAATDPGPDRAASCRRQRGRGRVEGHHRRHRSGGADPEPPEHPGAGHQRRACDRGRRPGRLRGASTRTRPTRSSSAPGPRSPSPWPPPRRSSAEGVSVRVVSLPSWELFEAQDAAYRASVLPAGVPDRVGRGRRHRRLEPLRAGVGRHRPLRRLRAGWRRARRARASTPATSPRRSAACSRARAGGP